MENGGNVDSLFLDFEKAFDKVDHGLLCHRLKEKGITKHTGIWIANFLKEQFTENVLIFDTHEKKFKSS